MRSLSSGPARLLRATCFAAVIALSVAAAVSAKTPYFTVEITPAAPVADEPILVVVRTWDDADHTIPAHFDAVEAMDGLLVVRAAGGGAPDIPVTLRLREPDRFEGSVTLPAGDWTLVAFPDRTGWSTAEVPAGYPNTVALTVREPGPDLPAFAIPLVAVAAVLVALALRLRLRPRLASPIGPFPS
jgi:hypothetical protein